MQLGLFVTTSVGKKDLPRVVAVDDAASGAATTVSCAFWSMRVERIVEVGNNDLHDPIS